MSKSVIGDVVRLGWPVFIAQIAVMTNGLIDTVMAGRYSTVDLAAIGVGSSIYFSVFVAMMGVLLALSPIASQLYGAQRFGAIGEEVRQSGWLALGLAVAGFLILRYPGPFLAISELPPEVEVRARDYLAAMSWGVPAMLAFRVFYSFSTAVSKPRTMMLLNLCALAIKVPLNWVFMYGYFGVPELGGVGCAWSSTVIAWFLCIAGWFWCRMDPAYRRYGVFERWSWPRWRSIANIISLGLPIGLTFFVDVTGFTFMALFIARLGPENSAAHQIAANFAAMLFMLPLALGNASSVLVGQAIGARDFARARATGIAGLGVAMLCAVFVGGALALGKQTVADLYTIDPAVSAIAASLLGFVAIYHLVDSLQAVAVNVLRGYKRAVVPMVIYAVALWGVGLGGGTTLGLHGIAGWVVPLGAKGFWIAAIASLTLAGGLVTAYFLYVSRRPDSSAI